jgi:3-oxoadipate enol-lactonase
MPRVRIDGAELYYEEHGSGPALVFVHGGGGNHLSWWQQIPVFSGRHRCITYDQRGFGSSTPVGSAAPDVLTSDLIALLDHLRIERACLVAQSLGGWTAWGLAARQPQRVRALLMADTPGGVPTPAAEGLFAGMQSRMQRGEAPLARAIGPQLAQTRPDLAFLYWQIQGLNPALPPAAGGGLVSALARRVPAPEFRAPTLFVVGEQDEMIPPDVIEAAARAVPGARLLRVPNAGHSVYFERADVFNAALAELLREAEKSEGAGL